MGVPVYRGKFDASHAERLLWRAGFGPRRGEAEALANAAEATRQRDRVQNQSMLVRARQYAATGHTAEIGRAHV